MLKIILSVLYLYQSGLKIEVGPVIPAKAGIQKKPQNSNRIGILSFPVYGDTQENGKLLWETIS